LLTNEIHVLFVYFFRLLSSVTWSIVLGLGLGLFVYFFRLLSSVTWSIVLGLGLGLGMVFGFRSSVFGIISQRRHLRQSHQCVECNSQRPQVSGSINYNVIYQSECFPPKVTPQPRRGYLLFLLPPKSNPA